MTWFNGALADKRLDPTKISTIDLTLPLLWRVYSRQHAVDGFNRTSLGKRPDWFKAALAAGRTTDDLLVKR